MGPMGNQNHTFKYSTEELLAKLKENRTKHEANYKEAMAKYREALKKELQKKLEEANNGADVSHSIKTIRPLQYLSTYDRFITMFEMMVETEIELDSATFAQLVLDEWDWSHNFANSTMLYNG